MSVRWGILGSGQMAGHLSWVLTQVPGCVRVEGRYRELLADPAVDVVYVALPNHLHLPWVSAALAAGKHVLCEKPLGLSAAEVRALPARGQREPGPLLVEAAFWRWQPRVQRLAELVARIGPVEHVEAGFSFPDAAGWRLEAAAGGGALHDLGCYPVGAALDLSGPVEAVSARTVGDSGEHPGEDPGRVSVDLSADLVLDHRSGATTAVHVSIAGPRRQWLRVTGSGGELELPGDAYTGPGEVWLSAGTGTERIAVSALAPGLSGYAEMVAAVAAAVRGEPAYLPDGALAVAEVLDAARTSARSGGTPTAPIAPIAPIGPTSP